MLHFATEKLLGGPNLMKTNDTGDALITSTDQSIACLSVRFPLEFNFAYPNVQNLVRKQIEHHMRLCTVATSSFDVLFSTVGSEPLLAEAASHAMAINRTNPIRELSDIMDKNCINHSEHGELVAALLIMQARDAVTKGSERRWVYVCEFMESLLGTFAATATTLPCKMHSSKDRKSLGDRFKHARMWFNHVLKIRKAHLINVQYLWEFIARGAMILCTNNQPGVDIVIPIHFSDGPLSRNNVTAILVQVKNDLTFGENMHSYLFDAMDPFHINLFNKDGNKSGKAPLPIIRMVFALASEQSAVKWSATVGSGRTTRQSERTDPYTSYDVWCAGISKDTFSVITDKGESDSYKKILDRTRFSGEEYSVSKIHGIEYPEYVATRKAVLVRNFDALVTGEDLGLRSKGKSRQKGKQRAD